MKLLMVLNGMKTMQENINLKNLIIMKNLKDYNVKEMNNLELEITSGGGIGVWIAMAIDSVEGAIYDAFNSQYQNAYDAVANA